MREGEKSKLERIRNIEERMKEKRKKVTKRKIKRNVWIEKGSIRKRRKLLCASKRNFLE